MTALPRRTLGIDPGAAPAIPTAEVAGASPRWVYGYLAFQIGCQLALLTDALAPLRVLLRTASFGFSLLALVLIRAKSRGHAAPGTRWAFVVLLIVGIEFFHPTTSTPMAGVATLAMYAAILAPLFWIRRVAIDLQVLRRLLLILWAFHCASALVGTLQVYFPGQFQPAVASVMRDDYATALSIRLADGTQVVRPMGLTDTPGGAGIGGFYAVLLGLGMLIERKGVVWQAVIALGMGLGLFALYLSQVRALLVILAIGVITLGALLAISGRTRNAFGVGALLAAVAFVSLLFAVSVGGETVTGRLATLISDSPSTTYYTNRGVMLEHTLTDLLPLYPLGAGLGRWGMVHLYFGSDADPARAMIWAELQWPGWLLDGGLPLIVAYVGAILSAMYSTWRVGGRRLGAAVVGLGPWGAVIFAYDMGALALTFSYPTFMGNMGLEFWLLNSALFTVLCNEELLVKMNGSDSTRHVT